MSVKSFDSNNYESAAKDIEQEKKMVAALKRLSIGNSMSNYDPDFPVEDRDFQLVQEIEGGDLSPRGFTHHRNYSRSPPRNRKSGSDASQGPRMEESSLSRETEEEPDQEHETEENDEIFDSSNPLLWVPANAHPEVNPENFKTHLKTTVEDLVERQIGRKSTISRRSSLSRSFSTEKSDSENVNPNEEDTIDRSSMISLERNRKSNPSLRDLSNELEKLSKIAGMDANNAVTLARTLSTASLGYTDVERLAFDELNSSPRSSTSSEELNRSGEVLSSLEESPTRSDEGLRRGNQRSTTSSSHDFSLKRSRRLDYRKNGPTNTGAADQNQAQEFAHEATSDDENSQPLVTTPTKPNRQKAKVSNNPRNSQILFSYKNPNAQEDLIPVEYKPSNNSPYPSISSSSSLIEKKIPSNRYSQRNLTSKRLSRVKPSQDTNDNITEQERHIYSRLSNYKGHPGMKQKKDHEPKHYNQTSRQNPGHNKEALHDNRRVPQPTRTNGKGHGSQKDATKDILSSNIYSSMGRDASPYSQSSAIASTSRDPRDFRSQSRVPTANPQEGKSEQLNRNLNLLRSEINEFKESLTVNETIGTKSTSPEKVNKTNRAAVEEPDISFDLSYQDVSYEDSLGLDKEVLKELDSEQRRTSPKKSGSSPVSQSYNTEKNGYHEQRIEPKQRNKTNPYGDRNANGTKSDSNTMLGKGVNITPSTLPASRSRNNSTNKASPFRDNMGTVDSFSGKRNVGQEKIIEQQVTFPSDKKSTRLENTSPKSQPESPLSSVGGLQGPFQLKEERSAPNPGVSDLSVNYMPKKSYDNMIPPISDSEAEDTSSVESGYSVRDRKKFFGKLSNTSAESLSITDNNMDNAKKLKKKKSWAWMKERSVSLSSVDARNAPSISEEVNSPSRSFSNPELTLNSEPEQKTKQKSNEKENVIVKLFKKKKTQVPSVNLEANNDDFKDPGVTVSHDADSKVFKLDKKRSTNFFKKIKQRSNATEEFDDDSKTDTKEIADAVKTEPEVDMMDDNHIFDEQDDEDTEESSLSRLIPQLETSTPIQSPVKEKDSTPKEATKKQPKESREARREAKVAASVAKHESSEAAAEAKRERRKEKLKAHKMKRSQIKKEEEEEKTKQEVKQMNPAAAPADQVEVPSQYTQEIQEKLKRSIKRTSKANQPIQFTDSAFGFPLPPPSQSTLVMLDYRFPVHVERAIYRLSHLKLANPKRSLREQVLLSNFMYAYLNLVDHTLHLEQQQNSSLSGASEEPSDANTSAGNTSYDASTTNSMEVDGNLNNSTKSTDTLQT